MLYFIIYYPLNLLKSCASCVFSSASHHTGHDWPNPPMSSPQTLGEVVPWYATLDTKDDVTLCTQAPRLQAQTGLQEASSDGESIGQRLPS